MTSPAVSVCIPVYRGEQFLAETIRSVLAQTYRDFELVILDNASPDGTGRIARSFQDGRIRVETNPTVLPQPQNWRRAVELCRAPLIKLVCADDLLHPRCLELQAVLMDLDPGVAVVAARCNMIDESSRVLVSHRGLGGMTGRRTLVEVARGVVRSHANPIGDPGGVLFRREHYDTVGGWNPERNFAMDLDLWLRLLRHGEFFGRSESLAATRIFTNQPLRPQRRPDRPTPKRDHLRTHRDPRAAHPPPRPRHRADQHTARAATPPPPVCPVQQSRPPRRAT